MAKATKMGPKLPTSNCRADCVRTMPSFSDVVYSPLMMMMNAVMMMKEMMMMNEIMIEVIELKK